MLKVTSLFQVFILVASLGCSRPSDSPGSSTSPSPSVSQKLDSSIGSYVVTYSFQPPADSSPISSIELREVDTSVYSNFDVSPCAIGIPVKTWNSPFSSEDNLSGTYLAGSGAQFRYALCVRKKDGSVSATPDTSGSNSSTAASSRVVNQGPTASSTSYTATKVTSGQYFTCALFSNGRVKCWGNNQYGQLGLGDTTNRGSGAGQMGASLPYVDLGTSGTTPRTAISIAAGLNHVCAIMSDNTLKCWGRNNAGQLGYGDMISRGNAASTMGNALPTVSLGVGLTAKSLVVGGDFTCVILADDGNGPNNNNNQFENTVKCWGANTSGQLGRGNTTPIGTAPNQMGDLLPIVSLGIGRTAKMLAAGLEHVCALLDNNMVKCWGVNDSGQLGLGHTNYKGNAAGQMGDSLPTVVFSSTSTAASISAGASHNCVTIAGGTIKCWGDNFAGQLGVGSALEQIGDSAGQMTASLATVRLSLSVVLLQVGFYTTCAQLSNSVIKCWGANHYGQLGIASAQTTWGTTAADMTSLPSVDIGSSTLVKMFSSQYGTTCVINQSSVIKCWGININGALGYGDTTNRGGSSSQMGTNLPIVDL